MHLTLLTCAHNRPEAFALTERWIGRNTLKPFQWLVLCDSENPTVCTMGQELHYWPEFKGHGSMVNKIKRALEQGLIKGDALSLIEDDDWIAPDYLQWTLGQLQKYDLVGECENLYYNVKHRWWFQHHNRYHASLCATSMRRSVFPFLLECCNETLDPFIDSRLWSNCRLSKFASPPENGRRRSVGIKAMPGPKGYGSGHDRTSGWAQQDPNGLVLKSLIGQDADIYAQFYESPRKFRSITQVEEMPVIEVHIVSYNEAFILAYALRHYKTFASKIVVHDAGSTDGTLALCAAEKVQVEPWSAGASINDTLLRELKETCWRDTMADWVIIVDADELLYFPGGVMPTLASYEARALAIVKPHGWEMESPEMPTTAGQIYEEINHGAPDDRWYAKPCMFSPRRVQAIKYSAGAHECAAELVGGLMMGNPERFSEPPALLLHYKHIGSVERIGERYDGNRARFSQENIRHGWGNYEPGVKHATDKRNAILKNRSKVL